MKTPVQRDQESGPCLGLVFEAPDWAPMMGARPGLLILRPKNAHDLGLFLTRPRNNFGTEVKTVVSAHHGTPHGAHVTLSTAKTRVCTVSEYGMDANASQFFGIEALPFFLVSEVLLCTRQKSNISNL